MADPFSGTTYVVTGAASGIGAATSEALRARGANVATIDLAGEVDHALDVTDAAAVRAAFDAIAAEHGEISGVVHSAGILSTGPFAELDVERQLAIVHVNVGGTVSVAHAAIAHLRATRGSLVMMGSASGFQGPPEYATYGATKAAVITLAQSLRIELEDDGIHVATCNPLFTATPMLGKPEEGAALLRSMGAVHTADEVAAAIVRGIERRSPMILPGFKPKAMRFADNWLGGLGHTIMRLTWRRSRRAAVTRA
jgi:short-subunit dehydrogenase